MLPRGSGSAPQEMKYPVLGYQEGYGHEAAPNPGMAFAPWVHLYPQGPIHNPYVSQFQMQLQGPPPPIVYPHPTKEPKQQGPPVPPRTRPPVKKEDKQNETEAGTVP